MTEKRQRARFRFSIRAAMALLTVVAVGLASWIFYSKHRMQKLVGLRDQGVIIIVRDRTPQLLQYIGIRELSPFFDVPTVELYVTPVGEDAYVGNSNALVSREEAEGSILQQASTARSYGADDLQLILIDNFDSKWMGFGDQHSLSVIEDGKERYAKRLRANQENGANLNP
jgi:hypothetical protein